MLRHCPPHSFQPISTNRNEARRKEKARSLGDSVHDENRKSAAYRNIISRPERLIAQLGKVKPSAPVIHSGDLYCATKEDGNALGLGDGRSVTKYFFQLLVYVVIDIIIVTKIIIRPKIGLTIRLSFKSIILTEILHGDNVGRVFQQINERQKEGTVYASLIQDIGGAIRSGHHYDVQIQ